ncbi:methyltransferase domain-containing protein [Sphingobium yanoikuyae]|uniref:methyltransferase domain-containing protein n=1 Tax=Sphingobium yanoikuyae TaxID=13690 RepID=UPI0028B1B917|nr:methyltransferase domain-containing protein [Sphingobium yanoikuyae]
MAQPNVYQVSDWNGSSGERWVTHRQRLDAMLAPFGDAAIAAAAVQPGERVLDVGCGAGTSSIALARQVGATGEVLGLDISGPLIALARSQQPADLPIRYALADAGSATLTTHGFNLLFSRFGGRRRTMIGCPCRWARSATSCRRWRRPTPKRPAPSPLAIRHG